MKQISIGFFIFDQKQKSLKCLDGMDQPGTLDKKNSFFIVAWKQKSLNFLYFMDQPKPLTDLGQYIKRIQKYILVKT